MGAAACGALCDPITDEDIERYGRPPQPEPQAPPGKHANQAVQRAFDTIDANGDGFIDRNELQRHGGAKARMPVTDVAECKLHAP